MVEQVLRFESELYKAKRLPATLLAAALVMSNKFVAKERLRALCDALKALFRQIFRCEDIRDFEDPESNDDLIGSAGENLLYLPAWWADEHQGDNQCPKPLSPTLHQLCR